MYCCTKDYINGFVTTPHLNASHFTQFSHNWVTSYPIPKLNAIVSDFDNLNISFQNHFSILEFNFN